MRKAGGSAGAECSERKRESGERVVKRRIIQKREKKKMAGEKPAERTRTQRKVKS